MKELKISAIKEGTVIDHIPPKNTFKLAEILSIGESEHIVSVAKNLNSKKSGKKGIIKLGGRNLTKEEQEKVALLAPDATISLIKDYNVSKKLDIKPPKEAYNLIVCNNPVCITNMEKTPTKFTILTEKPITARCEYCERTMSEEEIKLK